MKSSGGNINNDEGISVPIGGLGDELSKRSIPSKTSWIPLTGGCILSQRNAATSNRSCSDKEQFSFNEPIDTAAYTCISLEIDKKADA